MTNWVLTIMAITLFTYSHVTTAANILDYLWTDVDENVEQRQDNPETNPKTCQCLGPMCVCCVDFNLTYIDLGGPGCVQMRYINQSEGLMVNVSYGDNLLHSEQVKGPNPNPTCMSLLGSLAHVCARFSNLQSYQDGLQGCVNLEPKLLGDVTASFKIGCFIMGPNGMTMEKSNSTIFDSIESPITTQNNTHNEPELLSGDLLAVVNESAEQGLAFLGNLLGLTFDSNKSGSAVTEKNDSETTEATSVEE